MNTNPDETRLALWLEDELTGDERAAFEEWLADRPEHFAAREEARQWRAWVAATLPAEEALPYPDFFNSRIQREIHKTATPAAQPQPGTRLSWRTWLMPLAACVGMAFTFLIGQRSAPPGTAADSGRLAAVDIDVTDAPRAIPVEPIVYTPDLGVEAEWFASDGASAMVIVLSGVEPIPDSTDFGETAWTGPEDDGSRTSETGSPQRQSPES